MPSYTPPTVGGDNDSWGTELNAILATFSAAIDANTAAIGSLNPNASLPVVTNFELDSVTETTATLSWGAPVPESPTLGIPTHYLLRVVASTHTSNVVHYISEVPLTIGGLDPGIVHTATIWPYWDTTAGGGVSLQFTTTAADTGGTSGDLPNGEAGSVFNGALYYEAADHADFSIVTHSPQELSWECWIKLDNVNQTVTDGGSENRIHFLGKGQSSQQEWTARYYSANTSATDRPMAFSAYHFSLAGGTGSGAKALQTVGGQTVAGEWFHIVGTYAVTGLIDLYKNGARGATHQSFLDPTYNVVAANGTAPVRIGTRDAGATSRLQGKMAKVAIYSKKLTEAEVDSHYNEMFNPTGDYDALVNAHADLVAFWPLDPGSPLVDASGNGHTLTAH